MGGCLARSYLTDFWLQTFTRMQHDLAVFLSARAAARTMQPRLEQGNNDQFTI
jgi:hypothetical protein